MTEEGSCPPEFVPATRAGATEDMAGTILHLCSRAGAYCNGNVVITGMMSPILVSWYIQVILTEIFTLQMEGGFLLYQLHTK